MWTMNSILSSLRKSRERKSGGEEKTKAPSGIDESGSESNVKNSGGVLKIRLRKYFSRAPTRLLLSYIAVILTLAVLFIVSFFFFRSVSRPREQAARAPTLDIKSFFLKGKFRAPDPKNPSVTVQEHLEYTRKKEFKSAYNLLVSSLKEKITIGEFIKNVDDNGLLLKHISDYEFPDFKLEGERATVKGKIIYETGEVSIVKASLLIEENRWRVSSLLIWLK